MLSNEMSAIETEPSNTIDTTEATLLSEPRRVELLKMSLQNLQDLLDASGLSMDLAAHLPTQILQNPASEVVVMTTMDTGEWPKEPPPVEERRMVTAVADISALDQQNQFIASGLAANEEAEVVEVVPVSGSTEIDVLVEEGLRFASGFDGGMAVSRLGRADQHTVGSSRTVRRSRVQRNTRVGSHWDKGTLVATADGFNQPPDVG